jgi:hypothetical protein
VSTAADYQARLEQIEQCTRKGCREPASDGTAFCAPHHDDQKKRQKASMAKLRRRRRRAKLCVWCPDDRPTPVPRGESSCPLCRVKRSRVSMESVNNGVNNSDRDARIAAATKMHPDGRARYHGTGKKGKQPDIRLDGQDLGFARKAMTAGEVGLELYDLEVQKSKAKDPYALPKVQRDDIKDAALCQLNRATGHIEDVLERRGHFGKRHGPRDGKCK